MAISQYIISETAVAIDECHLSTPLLRSASLSEVLSSTAVQNAAQVVQLGIGVFDILVGVDGGRAGGIQRGGRAGSVTGIFTEWVFCKKWGSKKRGG